MDSNAKTGTRICTPQQFCLLVSLSNFCLTYILWTQVIFLHGLGVRSPAESKDFSSSLWVHTSSLVHPASYSMGTGGPFPGVKRGWGVTLTSHHHLVPRSRMRSAFPANLPFSHRCICSPSPRRPTSNMLPIANISCVPIFCYHSVYCCPKRYFLFRIRVVKFFTKSSKRFRCEVMLKNGRTFCAWIHHLCTCTAFAQLALETA
jgi:hypothetical protein